MQGVNKYICYGEGGLIMSQLTFYAEQYSNITGRDIEHMTNFNYTWTHSIGYYRDAYASRNGDSSPDKFYEWFRHFWSSDWETDIFFMSNEEFEYHWPIHAIYIKECSQ